MENYKVDMGKNNKFKRNNILSFIFLMFMVSMIAMPNFTPKSFKHDVKNDKFLPVKFPWTIKVNRLSLINCVNYSPSTDATVNITISGNTISAILPSANSERLGGIKISFSNGVLTITT